MARFIVQGGKRLAGRYTPPGNKNAALPMLAACVLTDEPVILENVPAIEDVRTMLEILEELGVDIQSDGNTTRLCAAGLHNRRLSTELCRRVRSSILFAGPMVARHGFVELFPPGGDVIGRRRLDTHLDGLAELGVAIRDDDYYAFSADGLHGADILLDEASVTATENIVMAAVLAEGETTLFNAACEPHVQDLCRLLCAMGAHIEGIGTNFLRIRGVSALGGTQYRVSPDYINVASFVAAAAVTGGQVEVTDCNPSYLRVIKRGFAKLGVTPEFDGHTLSLAAEQELAVRNDFGRAIPKLEDGPWPAFPSDLMSIAIVMATQADGTMLFFEKMFESRMYFVDRLIEMGARIVQCDPHRVIVSGPSPLHGTHLSSPDIRAGMALVVAALCAQGTSVIDNAQCIDRGYERIDETLSLIGAEITREE